MLSPLLSPVHIIPIQDASILFHVRTHLRTRHQIKWVWSAAQQLHKNFVAALDEYADCRLVYAQQPRSLALGVPVVRYYYYYC